MTRREEIEVELHELDQEIYRNEDNLKVWQDIYARTPEEKKNLVKPDIDRINDEILHLREARAAKQSEYDATPTTQDGRGSASGDYSGFIRKLQHEGRLPQD